MVEDDGKCLRQLVHGRIGVPCGGRQRWGVENDILLITPSCLAFRQQGGRGGTGVKYYSLCGQGHCALMLSGGVDVKDREMSCDLVHVLVVKEALKTHLVCRKQCQGDGRVMIGVDVLCNTMRGETDRVLRFIPMS